MTVSYDYLPLKPIDHRGGGFSDINLFGGKKVHTDKSHTRTLLLNNYYFTLQNDFTKTYSSY